MKTKRKNYWLSVLLILCLWIDGYSKEGHSFYIAITEGFFSDVESLRYSISNDLSVSEENLEVRKAYPYAQSGSFRENIYRIQFGKEEKLTSFEKEIKKRAYISS